MSRSAFGDHGKHREALRRIAGMIAERPPLPRSSLFIGEAGVALFLALAARELDEARFWELAQERLAGALAAPSRLPTFAGGYFGELWTASRFAELGADVDADIDELLDARLAANPPDPEFDLLNGWAGIIVYALARRATPGGADRLAAAVDRLDRIARRDGDGAGATWFRTPAMLTDDVRPQFPHGHFCLGVDHGQAGVIGTLCDAIVIGGVARAAPLVDAAVRWLLAHRRAGPGRAFPALIDPERGELAGRPDANLFGDTGRESWSHGDLGIATALLAAARVRRRADWEAIALAVADAAAARITPAELDWADLCDGRAGLAYLFTCLHRATGAPRFAAAAQQWLEAAWAGISDRLTTTVMTGLTGIGLATIAAMHDRAAPWESALGVGTV